MRYLAATMKTQGKKGDFCFVPEGEIVTMSATCDNGNACGCTRSMCGVHCYRATTTVKVVDDKLMTRAKFQKILTDSYIAAGWTSDMPINDSARKRIDREADAILSIADSYPVGAVLQIDGSKVIERSNRNGG